MKAISHPTQMLNFKWEIYQVHDDVIKWKHFPRYWPFVRRIHRSPVNSPHKGQWRGALMFSLICVWINDWVNNGEAGDLRRYRIHYDVTVMFRKWITSLSHIFQWDAFSPPCPNFNNDFVKPPFTKSLLKLGHGWVITFHRFQWAYSYIYTCPNGDSG